LTRQKAALSASVAAIEANATNCNLSHIKLPVQRKANWFSFSFVELEKSESVFRKMSNCRLTNSAESVVSEKPA